MTRVFAPITEEELQDKIATTEGKEDPSFGSLLEYLARDLKVNFDWENVMDDPDDIHGYHSFSNGLTFYGVSCGGDWECPVFFIVYWDGKRLRGYVPTVGNPWNTDTKEAYGNDEAKDLKNAKKRWPEVFQDATEVEAGDFELDHELIQQDLLAHFTPTAQKQPARQRNPDWKRAKAIIEELQEIIRLAQEVRDGA